MNNEHQEYEEFEENLEGQEENELMSYEDIVDAKKITFEDIKEHMTGPVISTVLHVILIAFLGTIIVFEAPKDEKEIQVEMKVIEPPEIEKIPEPPEPVEVETEVEVEIERPEVETENVEVTVEDVAVANTQVEIELPNVLNVKMSNSALQMPALYQSRSGKGRKGALNRHGGSSKTELAVVRGLRWLKEHQNADGSWGDNKSQYFPAYTGMALMAFLGHNETPSSPEFGNTVKKAIMKLVEYTQNENTLLSAHGYQYPIVTYALAEAYALTQIEMLEPVVNKQIRKLVTGMNPAGSYDYAYKLGGRSDLSYAGWNYQALKAAFAAGCTVEGLEDTIDRAKNTGLKQTHWNEGKKMFGYSANGGGARSTMTAVGVLCLQLFGEGKSPEAKGGLETLEDAKYFWFSWKGDETGKVGKWSLYQWYYQTQAIFQGHSGDGPIWKSWNKMFSTELVRKQKIETKNGKKMGYWHTPAYEHDPGKGGHGEAMFKGLDQPVYATALCCLMLEVYYRYLPTFKVAKIKQPKDNNGGGSGGGEEEDMGLSMEAL